ncbi:hypothetical protein ACWC5I_07710, partial [Kitasatospora sp. NPDC001574]
IGPAVPIRICEHVWPTGPDRSEGRQAEVVEEALPSDPHDTLVRLVDLPSVGVCKVAAKATAKRVDCPCPARDITR